MSPLTNSNRSWYDLSDRYRKEGLVLVLGAGVSIGSQLPTWRDLLQRIGERCQHGAGKLVKDLQEEGFNLPAITGMLRAIRPKGRSFAEIVREVLYQKFHDALGNSAELGSRKHALVKFVKDKNKTLRTVAALCVIADREAKFTRNRRVHAIVNFNIDNVLRNYMRACYRYYGQSLDRTIERPSKGPRKLKRLRNGLDPKRVSIYYMHGYLRPTADKPGSEAADKLVLSEHEYFDRFNSPTSLFNYTFLYLLREHPCLFIGHSMQDENVRRLLHYSVSERIEAYHDEKDKDAERQACRHFAILKRYDSSEINRVLEYSLSHLGTRVLWVNHYDEIPDRLGEMYSSTGDKWHDVY